jgi:hypothetical protein
VIATLAPRLASPKEVALCSFGIQLEGGLEILAGVSGVANFQIRLAPSKENIDVV